MTEFPISLFLCGLKTLFLFVLPSLIFAPRILIFFEGLSYLDEKGDGDGREDEGEDA